MPLQIHDLLGGLADAFLLQAGHQPMYQKWKDEEALKNINLDFENDPMGTLSRINKVNPELAQKYASMVETNNYKRAYLDMRRPAIEAQADLRGAQADEVRAKQQVAQDKLDAVRRGHIGSMMLAAARSKNPKSMEAASSSIMDLSKKWGIDLTGMPLPTDPEDSWLAWATDPKTFIGMKQNQQKVDAATTQAGAAVTRAGAAQVNAAAHQDHENVYRGINSHPDGSLIPMDAPGRHQGKTNPFTNPISPSGAPKRVRVINGVMQRLQPDGSYK